MRLKVFILSLFVLIPLTVRADKAPLSIRYQDLPQLIRERNEAVRGAELQVESNHARTGYLKRALLPQANVYGGGEHFKTGDYSRTSQPYGGAEVSLNLFRGGKDSQEDKIRESQTLISATVAQTTYQQELSSAQILYWQMLYNKELIEHLKQAAALKEQGIQAAQRRFRRGLVTRTDLTEFEIYGGRLKEQTESLVHENFLNSIRMRAILGLPEDAELEIAASRIEHEHDESVLKQDLRAEKNPEIVELRRTQEIVEFQQSKASRWWAPNLDVYGGYYLYTLRERTFDSVTDRTDTVLGARLQFNLFDGGHSSADARALSLQSNGLEKAALQKLRQLNALIKTTQGDMIHIHELLHSSEERIQQGLKYLKSTQEEYDRGVKNSPDLLSAIERYISYQEVYVERLRDYQKAKVNLLALLLQVKDSK